MICPKCASPNNRVVNSRDAQNGTAVRRRRECLNCGERFTTFETVEELPVFVIKRSGKREPYDRLKIQRGVATACRKRPVSDDQIGDIVGRVEQELLARPVKEISSREIGEMVLAELRQVDEVAHIRFASVYREFENAHQFQAELEELIRGKAAPAKR